MATNKAKTTTAAKPRRFGMGIVLSCVQSLRRRPKPPQVLERSLATTGRRGSGRKTVPLDLELVDIPSMSLDGSGDVKKMDAGAGELEEISSLVRKPNADRDELTSMGKLPADSKKETPEISSAPTHDLDQESITENLAGSAANEVAKIVAEDQFSNNNDTIDQSLASPEQETAQKTIQNTEDLAGNSAKVNADNVSGDQHISLDQSGKEETDEIIPDLSEQSETQMKSDDPTMKIPTSDLDAQLIRLLHPSLPNKTAENFKETSDQNTEDSAVNTKQKEFIPVPISNDEQETYEIPTNQYSDDWKQDLEEESADNIGEESETSLPTSSPLSLFREFLTAENFEETIDQNTEDSAVNTKQKEFFPIPISNDDQETNKKPTNQHSEYWKQDLEAESADNIGEESKASLPTSSPLPLFREFLTAENFEETIHPITEDSAKNSQQKEFIPVSSSNDDQETNKIATNQHSDYWKQDLVANNPALAESTDNIGEESKSSLRTSSPLSLFREFLTAWSGQYRSPYAYLLLLPIGMAVIFLVILGAWGILLFILVFAAVVAILLSVGVCALLLFSVSAVAGTGMLSVWAGTLWALWISGRVGFAAIKFLVSSVSRASSAFNL